MAGTPTQHALESRISWLFLNSLRVFTETQRFRDPGGHPAGRHARWTLRPSQPCNIILWRKQYLVKIKQYRREGRFIYYQDETWVNEGILPRLKPNSVLVMDNAPYHSRRMEIGPTKKWNKGQLIQWLQERNIVCDMSMLRAQLWDLVEKDKPKFEKKAVDELAAAHNITILRLPPYHCELNPIELVWAQVKGHVAKNNKTFKMADVQSLFHEGLELVTPERWRSCIEHVIKVEDEMCQLDLLIDDVTEPFIINTNDDELSGSELED
ncbi:uncharacterized protein LOC134654773 [Cydia amplana]|uniref:uncharacterized protein LOC134654773 n=1 Tax=Cydia amplana TaxID=1869771 RepID=UPI002FE50427